MGDNTNLEATIDETCPYCGEEISDLCDYNWRGASTIDTECPYCDEPIRIEAEYSIDYTISTRKAEQWTQEQIDQAKEEAEKLAKGIKWK